MSDLFFLASKGFWALARPDSLLLLALLCGWLRLGRAPGAGRRWIGGALLAFALIGGLPLYVPVLRPLEARFPVNPPVGEVAGILVLGGGEDINASARSGQPQMNEAGDRYLAALALARRFPGARVVFTGGAAQLRTRGQESRVAAQILIQGGLSPDRLTVEDQSRNTAENARLSRALVGPTEGPWLLVTSATHMPRAIGSFCAAGWTGLVPWPTDFRAVPLRWGWDPAGHLTELNGAVKEWIGLLAYRVTGRTDRLLPEGCPPAQ